MPMFGSSRYTIFAAAVASAGIGAIGFSTIGFGAAVIGESRKVEITQKAPGGLDALKALYRRPSTIPFPKENPYTPEKRAAGKEAVFRPPPLGDIGAVLRELPQPRVRLGRRADGRRRPRHGEARASFTDHRQRGLERHLHVGCPSSDTGGAGARPDPVPRRNEHEARRAHAAAFRHSRI